VGFVAVGRRLSPQAFDDLTSAKVVAEEGMSDQGSQQPVSASQTKDSHPIDDHAAFWGTFVGHTQRFFPKMHRLWSQAFPVPGAAAFRAILPFY
jgi:hypothetical protein